MKSSILVIEDDKSLAENIKVYLVGNGFEVVICLSAEEALRLLARRTFDVVLTDNSLPMMSGIELVEKLRAATPQLKMIMMTGYGKIDEAVRAMQAGAFHYLTKPFPLAELKLLVDKALTHRSRESSLAFYHEQDANSSGLKGLVGNSPVMAQLKGTMKLLLDAERNMNEADLPVVLIEGETGTGKELIAKALHFGGQRAKGPFVEINCASFPSHLLEAELFGHEKGAFTDAKERRIGLVEAAEGGTLFLDEVGELDVMLQAKLLKLLEDRTIRRLGSVKEHRINLRIISATNCDLERMVDEGKFRRDLFFRLRIISLKVPPLRARGDDIQLLARQFLQEHGRRYGKPGLEFAADAAKMMREYSWPGNVRELRNMLEQTTLLAQSSVIYARQLSVCSGLSAYDLEYRSASAGPGIPVDDGAGVALPEVERNMVEKMLERTDWNVTKSARMLGISRDMLRYRIDKLGLNRPSLHLR